MSLASRLRFGESHRPAALRYGVALAATLIALGASVLLDPLTGGRAPFLLFVVAVVVAAWYGGLGPAMAATVAAVAAAEWLLLEPTGRFMVHQATDVVALVVFVVVAVLVSWISGRTRLALDELRERTADLQLRQEALRRRESEVRALVEHSPDLMVRVDRDLRYLYVNPAVERLLDRSAGEFVGHSLSEAAHYAPPELIEVWEATIGRVLASGEPATAEFSLPTPNGARFFHTRVEPETAEDGTVASALAIARDITDRRAAEERQAVLVEAGRLATSSLDAATITRGVAELVARRAADWCVVWLLDETGEAIERVEHAAADPRREKQGEEVFRRYPPKIGRRDEPLARALRGGEETLLARVDESVLRRSTREPEHLAMLRRLDLLSMVMVPLAARGRVLGAMAIGTVEGGRRFGDDDLALTRELATEVGLALDNARLYAQLGQAVRLRDDILAIVAHDLRNPLYVVSSLVGVFEETAERPDRRFDARRAADAVRRALRRADRLIQDLLDISRIEAGRLSVTPEVVDVDAVVAEVCESAQARAAEKALRVDGAVDPGCPPLAADRARVVQALGNLLDNALEHSPEGARVTVRAAAGEASGEVELSVSDEGPGIREEDLPHLFDRFWQGGRATRGTGLGLAIVKGIAEAHGGRVAVASRPGQGSTFRILLPAAVAAAGELDEAGAAAG
ncbi:MAG TPA: ATP-binding protein [Thermoanaerobaculia bacterium]